MIFYILLKTGEAMNLADQFNQTATSGSDDMTLLMHAAKVGNLDVVKLLLEQGADINLKPVAASAVPATGNKPMRTHRPDSQPYVAAVPATGNQPMVLQKPVTGMKLKLKTRNTFFA